MGCASGQVGSNLAHREREHFDTRPSCQVHSSPPRLIHHKFLLGLLHSLLAGILFLLLFLLFHYFLELPEWLKWRVVSFAIDHMKVNIIWDPADPPSASLSCLSHMVFELLIPLSAFKFCSLYPSLSFRSNLNSRKPSLSLCTRWAQSARSPHSSLYFLLILFVIRSICLCKFFLNVTNLCQLTVSLRVQSHRLFCLLLPHQRPAQYLIQKLN